MTTTRAEALSDGIIAIIITIMVLELHVPAGADVHVLREVLPEFLTYVFSFVMVGIYWNNHHHMMHITEHVNGAVLWANLHLMFWLSLIPATTAWLGRNPAAAWPTAVYGINLLAAAFAYIILQATILRVDGRNSPLGMALGRDFKGSMSPVFYIAGIALAFVLPVLSLGLYVVVALLWLKPDPRIERQLDKGVRR